MKDHASSRPGDAPSASETVAVVDERSDPLFIEAVARAMRVLEAFADDPEPMSLSALAAAAGIGKSTAQRLAHTLARLGYLEQTKGGLVPGRKLMDRTHDYLRSNPLVARAVPSLADLRRTVQERVDLSMFDDLWMLYLVRLQSKRDSFYAHLIGRRVPTFCTSGGRAVLARMSDDAALDIITRSDRRRLTPRTTIDPDAAMRKVEETRRNGYAVAVEEVIIGEIAIGAAIVDKLGAPIGAIHVAGTLAEWEPDEFERRVAPLAVAAAAAISVH